MLPSSVYAATTKQVCLTAKGALFVRSKCRRGEKVFSATTFNQTVQSSAQAAGPAGPIGVQGIQGVLGQLGLQGNQGPRGIAGIKGPKGTIDFSGCRIATASTSNFANPANPSTSTFVTCNPNTEFVYDDDYKITVVPFSTGTEVFIQSRISTTNTIAGDTREYQIDVQALRTTTVGSGIYILDLRAVCCPW